jgi:hypothetical protein
MPSDVPPRGDSLLTPPNARKQDQKESKRPAKPAQRKVSYLQSIVRRGTTGQAAFSKLLLTLFTPKEKMPRLQPWFIGG